MIYYGSSFVIPSFLSFGVFIAWLMVLNRMTNLRMPMRYRCGVLAGTAIMFWLAVTDLRQNHYFESLDGIVTDVTMKTLRNVWNIAVAVAIYVLIGKLFPVRMAICQHEPTPVQYGIEGGKTS